MSARIAGPVHVAMMNLLWPRRGLPVQNFYDYWVGAHTQISSRLPGIHQYFQHQLDPVAGRSYPRSMQLSRGNEVIPGFYGDAEITFTTEQDLKRFADSLAPLMADEQNVFEKTISYQAVKENICTLKDESFDDSPNGDLGEAEKYLMYLKCDPSVAISDFRRVISDEVGPSLAASSDISKVRIRLLEFYDNDKVTLLAPNVSNYEEAKDQYQGCVEIMFTNAFARRKFGESEASTVTADKLLAICSEIDIMRALKTFTVYNHGSITTAGLRSPQMADQIRAIGAINQIDDSVRDLILKEHTHFSAK